MLTAEENDLLCRVEGDAPMGQIMRRHWLPACLSEEVAERDGAPVVVRLLGEDLVAFRASDGRLGVVGAHCPHRRASLALGRNEECGLRCLYHGWKIDVAGNILEMPSEPADSRFSEKVKHAAYPTHEAAGLVWVFMGPAEEMPMFEPPAFQPSIVAPGKSPAMASKPTGRVFDVFAVIPPEQYPRKAGLNACWLVPHVL